MRTEIWLGNPLRSDHLEYRRVGRIIFVYPQACVFFQSRVRSVAAYEVCSI
jgi:hypothetical protein